LAESSLASRGCGADELRWPSAAAQNRPGLRCLAVRHTNCMAQAVPGECPVTEAELNGFTWLGQRISPARKGRPAFWPMRDRETLSRTGGVVWGRRWGRGEARPPPRPPGSRPRPVSAPPRNPRDPSLRAAVPTHFAEPPGTGRAP